MACFRGVDARALSDELKHARAQASRTCHPSIQKGHGQDVPSMQTKKPVRDQAWLADGLFLVAALAADARASTGESSFVVIAAKEVALCLIYERVDSFTAIQFRFRDHRDVRNVQVIVAVTEIDVQLAENRSPGEA